MGMASKLCPMIDSDVIASLPKVELHDHLDGGLRPSTIVELAGEIGYELPTTDPQELEKWFYDAANSGDLPTYLTTFDHTTAVMQTKDALVRVTREAVEDLAADNVVYAELRYAPEQHVAEGLSLQDVVDATVQGAQEGERAAEAQGKRIHARLILCAMRHADRATEIAQLTVDNYPESSPGQGYVVGFDIAGAEDGFPASNHAEAFQLLRENLVPFTIHSGEAAGVDSIRDSLVQGTLRLGHGVRIYEDLEATLSGIELGPVARYVRDRGMPLEICPTSNTQTGIADDVADHPFNLLYELGFVCTIHTDNRLVSGTTMTREFEKLAAHFDLEYWQMLELTTNALDAAFCDAPLRSELEQTVIYPAYAELGNDLGMNTIGADGVEGTEGANGDSSLNAEGASVSHGLGGLHNHGVAGQNTEDSTLELSMENLKAELEGLGLSLDDDEPDSDDNTDDNTDGQ